MKKILYVLRMAKVIWDNYPYDFYEVFRLYSQISAAARELRMYQRLIDNSQSIKTEREHGKITVTFYGEEL